MQKSLSTRFAFGLLLFFILINGSSAELKIIATIKPIHSLASAITQGVDNPVLLLTGLESPHHYRMKPSDRKRLAESDIIFRVSPLLETFLNKILSSLDESTEVITLIDAEGIRKIPLQNDGLEPHADTSSNEDADEHSGHKHRHDAPDPHIWLDVDNAVELVRAISATLIKHDPGNQTIYEKNTADVIGQLTKLKQELVTFAQPLKNKSFIVFHNAYGYLDQLLGIKPVAAIQKIEGRMPGAQRMSRLLDIVKEAKVRCVFAEPDANTRVVTSLANSAKIKQGVLDIIGVRLKPGPDAYFNMMRNLLNSLQKCLA